MLLLNHKKTYKAHVSLYFLYIFFYNINNPLGHTCVCVCVCVCVQRLGFQRLVLVLSQLHNCIAILLYPFITKLSMEIFHNFIKNKKEPNRSFSPFCKLSNQITIIIFWNHNLWLFCIYLYSLISLKSCSCWNQFSYNYIFL